MPIDHTSLCMGLFGYSSESAGTLSVSRACLKSHTLETDPHTNGGFKLMLDDRPPCPDCGCKISKVSKTASDGLKILICQQCSRYYRNRYKRGTAPRRSGKEGGETVSKVVRVCPRCHGDKRIVIALAGMEYHKKCSECQGKGFVKR